MQFLGTKRTISEKVLNSLASHHHRPKIERSFSTSSHTKWRNLLPSWDDDYDQSRNLNYKALQDVCTLRRRVARKGRFLEPLCSSYGLNNGVNVFLSETNSPLRLCNSSPLTWIAARKSSNYLKSEERRSKLGRVYRLYDDDRGRQKLTRSAKAKRYEGEGYKNDSNNYDAILVLAGGQLKDGGVPVWVERRLDKALDLQQRSNSNGKLCKIVCLGGGTPHRAPILSSKGFAVHESTSCAEYLHSKGASFAHVIKEWASYDTIGNGYFSLTQHAIPRRWRTLAVVTSEFHMPRTRAVFEWIFGLQGSGLALQQREDQGQGQEQLQVEATGSRAQEFQLEFHSVPDHGDIDETIVQARLERERHSIRNLNLLSQRIQNLEDFHEWFHTEHKAYNTSDQHLFGNEDRDDPALQSY